MVEYRLRALRNNMDWWIWIVLGLMLVLGELVTPGGFYILFFGIAAIRRRHSCRLQRRRPAVVPSDRLLRVVGIYSVAFSRTAAPINSSGQSGSSRYPGRRNGSNHRRDTFQRNRQGRNARRVMERTQRWRKISRPR